MLKPNVSVFRPPKFLKSLAQRRGLRRSVRVVIGVWHQDADPPHLVQRLRLRRERPYSGSATKKCDEFPSPHGFAPAKDYIGYEKVAHFRVENCAVRDTKADIRPLVNELLFHRLSAGSEVALSTLQSRKTTRLQRRAPCQQEKQSVGRTE